MKDREYNRTSPFISNSLHYSSDFYPYLGEFSYFYPPTHTIPMKISLLLIGKTNSKFLIDGIQEYVKRLSFYIPFNIKYLNDTKNTRKLSQEQQKQLEGKMILDSLEKSDYVVLLDEHGTEFTSIEFARYIEKKQSTVQRQLVFIVGGPYGFSDDVKKRANEKISMSKMTFSHEMIRLFFVEQLYRAMTIINNEPYHHE